MLKLIWPTGPAVKIGWGPFGSLPSYSNASWKDNRILYPFGDTLGSKLSKMESQVKDPISVRTIFPYSSIPTFTVGTYEGNEPQTKSHHWYTQGGDLLDNTFSLFQGKWEEFYYKSVPGHLAKPAFHENLKGKAVFDTTYSWFRGPTLTQPALEWTQGLAALNPHSLRVRRPTGTSYTLTAVGHDTNLAKYDIQSALAFLSEQVRVGTYNYTSSAWTRVYANFQGAAGSDARVILSYEMTQTQISHMHGHSKWRATYRFELEVGAYTGYLAGSPLTIPTYSDQTVSLTAVFGALPTVYRIFVLSQDWYDDESGSWVNWLSTPELISGESRSMNCRLVAVRNTGSSSDQSFVTQYLVPTGHENPRYGLTQRFNDEIALIVQDCGLPAYYAQQDALNRAQEVLQSDWIETIKELAELGPIFDITADLVAAFMSSKDWRKRPSVTGKKWMDLISSATLLYQFGVAPTVAAAEELALLGNEVVSRFKQQGKARTVYGAYKAQVPDGALPSFNGTYIQTRALVRLTFSDETVLFALAGLKGVGLLPTLEQLWAYQPMSFFVDGSVDIGGKLANIDDSILGIAAFNIHYVVTGMRFSYNLFNKLTQYGFQPDIGLEVAPDDPNRTYEPALFHYLREANTLCPIVTDSKLAWQNPGHPPVATTGSLGYKLLLQDEMEIDSSNSSTRRRAIIRARVKSWFKKHKARRPKKP